VLVTVAIIPPKHVIDHVEAAMARTPVPPGEFNLVARGALMIPVLSLGNVARPEVGPVADFISDQLDRSRPPAQVKFAGVWALEPEGDPTVGLPLAGEVDQVGALVRSLWDLVSMRGYFVDRRSWAPRLTLGSVTATTSLPFLEHLVADLDTYASPVWTVSSVAFVRPRFDATMSAPLEVLTEVPTGATRP
jgi:2'-5' RNA ligase